MNHVTEFLRLYSQNTKGRVPFKTLYAKYRNYAQEHYLQPLRRIEFRQEIMKHGWYCEGCDGYSVRLPYDGHLDGLLEDFLQSVKGDPPISSLYIAFGVYCRRKYNMRSFELRNYIGLDEFEQLVSLCL
jgi:hypothetical protein